MGLLDKFNAVEIKADNRISEADKTYCSILQEAYNKSIDSLISVYDLLVKVTDEQKKIMGSRAAKMPEFLDGCSSSVSEVRNDIMNRHSKFVNAVVSYFENEYKVKLDRLQIIEHLIPQKPNSNRYDKDYEQDCKNYFESMKSLSLSYESVIDEIYTQLDGFSFEERAINELKKKCWDVTHRKSWYTDDAWEELFEVKGSTLRLTHGCSHSSWYENQWDLTETLRVVLDGIAHYFYGMIDYSTFMFPIVREWRVETDVFEYSGFITRIKLFKNGRTDIKFADSKCLNEFVEQYLRTKVGGNEDD